MRTTTWLSVLLCLIIVGPVLAQEQGVLLRLKYEVGETLTYRITVKGAGSLLAVGQNSPIDLDGSFDNIMRIEGLDDEGSFTILSTYDNVDLTVKVSNQDLGIPIKLPDMRLVVTPTGKVLDVKLIEGEEEGEEQQSLESMVASSLDLESLLQDLKCAPFPENAIQPGVEWDATVPAAAEGHGGEDRQMTMRLKYAANEEHLGRQCVRLESTHELPFGGEGGEGGLFNVTGVETGETISWFDPELGRIIADQGTSKTELKLTLPAGFTGGQADVGIFVEVVADTHAELVMPDEAEGN